MKIFLDDTRECPKGYTYVKTAEDCIKLLNEHRDKIEEISLDYDLGLYRTTGHSVCCHMVDNNIFPKKIVIHSSHPKGAKNMFVFLNMNLPENVETEITMEPRP